MCARTRSRCSHATAASALCTRVGCRSHARPFLHDFVRTHAVSQSVITRQPGVPPSHAHGIYTEQLQGCDVLGQEDSVVCTHARAHTRLGTSAVSLQIANRSGRLTRKSCRCSSRIPRTTGNATTRLGFWISSSTTTCCLSRFSSGTQQPSSRYQSFLTSS